MPAKTWKHRHTGKLLTVKSIHLANGNLLVLQRTAADRTKVEWVEAAPGTPLYKRWLPVAVDEPDPRTTP
jgi:hypothetical protein